MTTSTSSEYDWRCVQKGRYKHTHNERLINDDTKFCGAVLQETIRRRSSSAEKVHLCVIVSQSFGMPVCS